MSEQSERDGLRIEKQATEAFNTLSSLVRRLRAGMSISRSELAENCLLSEKTLARIENNEVDYQPSFKTVFTILKECGVTLENLAELFNISIEKNSTSLTDSSYDFTPNHMMRLKPYFDMKYHIFYYEAKSLLSKEAKQTSDGKGNIDESTITTWSTMNSEEGYLKAEVSHGKYKYTARIVSPTEYRYTYIYISSKPTIRERAILILPYNDKLTPSGNKFKAGIGVMLHFPTIDKHKTVTHSQPCFQQVLIVSEELRTLFLEKKEALVDEFLTMNAHANIFKKTDANQLDIQDGCYKQMLIDIGPDFYDRSQTFWDKLTKRAEDSVLKRAYEEKSVNR